MSFHHAQDSIGSVGSFRDATEAPTPEFIPDPPANLHRPPPIPAMVRSHNGTDGEGSVLEGAIPRPEAKGVQYDTPGTAEAQRGGHAKLPILKGRSNYTYWEDRMTRAANDRGLWMAISVKPKVKPQYIDTVELNDYITRRGVPLPHPSIKEFISITDRRFRQVSAPAHGVEQSIEAQDNDGWEIDPVMAIKMTSRPTDPVTFHPMNDAAISFIVGQLAAEPLSKVKGIPSALWIWTYLYDLYGKPSDTERRMALAEFNEYRITPGTSATAYCNQFERLRISLKQSGVGHELAEDPNYVNSQLLTGLGDGDEWRTFKSVQFQLDPAKHTIEEMYAKVREDEAQRKPAKSTRLAASATTSGKQSKGKQGPRPGGPCSGCKGPFPFNECWKCHPDLRPKGKQAKSDKDKDKGKGKSKKANAGKKSKAKKDESGSSSNESTDESTDDEPRRHEVAAVRTGSKKKSAGLAASLKGLVAITNNFELKKIAVVKQGLNHKVALNVTNPRTPSTAWYLDGCAEISLTNNKNLLYNVQATRLELEGVNGDSIATIKGDADIDFVDNDDEVTIVTVHDVFFNPQQSINLLSAGQLDLSGLWQNTKDRTIFNAKGQTVGTLHLDPEHPIYRIRTKNDFCGIVMKREKKVAVVKAFGTQTKASLYTWHRRLAHTGYDTILKIADKPGSGIQLSDRDRPDCEVCALYKLKQDPYTSSLRAKNPGDLINIDLVPKITPTGYGGEIGFITFTEAVTREDTVKTIKNRGSDPIQHVKDFTASWKTTHEGVPPRHYHFDNERFAKSNEVVRHCADEGIRISTTTSYNPKQNGQVEIHQHHILKGTACILGEANADLRLWPLAIYFEEWIKFRTPTAGLKGKSPYEIIHGEAPDLSFVRIWMSKAYGLVMKNHPLRVQSAKFDGVSMIGRLVGYEGDGTIKLVLLDDGSIERFKTVKAFENDTTYSATPISASDVSAGDEESPGGINLGKLIPVIDGPAGRLLRMNLSDGLRDSPPTSDNRLASYDSDYDPASAEDSASDRDCHDGIRLSEDIGSPLRTRRPRDVNDTYIDPTVKNVERITRDDINWMDREQYMSQQINAVRQQLDRLKRDALRQNSPERLTTQDVRVSHRGERPSLKRYSSIYNPIDWDAEKREVLRQLESPKQDGIFTFEDHQRSIDRTAEPDDQETSVEGEDQDESRRSTTTDTIDSVESHIQVRQPNWVPVDELGDPDELAFEPETVTQRRTRKRNAYYLCDVTRSKALQTEGAKGGYIADPVHRNFTAAYSEALATVADEDFKSDYSRFDTAIAMASHACLSATTPFGLPILPSYGSIYGSTPDPTSLGEAMNMKDRFLWWQATLKEYNTMMDRNVWQLVKEDEVPKNERVISMRWVYSRKRDENGNVTSYKARLVARGFMQVIDSVDTYAAVCNTTTIRALFAIAAHLDLEIDQGDAVAAYLHTDNSKPVYMHQPEGFVKPGYVCKVEKAMYGLKTSAKDWYQTVITKFLANGYTLSSADPSLLIKGNIGDKDGVIIPIYSDDFLFIGHRKAVDKAKRLIATFFEFKDLGPVRWYLGMQVTRDRSRKILALNQHAYNHSLLQTFGLGGKGRTVKTPLAPNVYHDKASDKATRIEQLSYAQRIGLIGWDATKTRPDLAIAASLLGAFAANPAPQHARATQHCGRYIRNTIYHGLVYGDPKDEAIRTYGGSKISQMDCYACSDSDFAQDRVERRSTGAYIFMLNGGPISWSSKKQSIIATSSTEAEYLALYQTIKEALWIRRLFKDIGWSDGQKPTTVFEDNAGAIQLATTNEYRPRTKHIDVQAYRIREEVQEGHVSVQYLETALNIADLLTKPLSSAIFDRLMAAVNVQDVRNVVKVD
jgi:hypothetical protein